MNPFQEVWQAFMKNQPQAMNGEAFKNPLGITPPMSVKEMDKKIGELETVENWMKVNLHMLQLSIQTLKQQKSMLEIFEGALTTPNAKPAAKAAHPMNAPMNSILDQWNEWVKNYPLTELNPLNSKAAQQEVKSQAKPARKKPAAAKKPAASKPRG